MIYKARLQGKQLPNAYILNLKTPDGFKPVVLMSFTGKMDEKNVTFGFVIDKFPENFKTAKEIYHDFLNN